jgi:hypothetical protein
MVPSFLGQGEPGATARAGGSRPFSQEPTIPRLQGTIKTNRVLNETKNYDAPTVIPIS